MLLCAAELGKRNDTKRIEMRRAEPRQQTDRLTAGSRWSVSQQPDCIVRPVARRERPPARVQLAESASWTRPDLASCNDSLLGCRDESPVARRNSRRSSGQSRKRVRLAESCLSAQRLNLGEPALLNSAAIVAQQQQQQQQRGASFAAEEEARNARLLGWAFICGAPQRTESWISVGSGRQTPVRR